MSHLWHVKQAIFKGILILCLPLQVYLHGVSLWAVTQLLLSLQYFVLQASLQLTTLSQQVVLLLLMNQRLSVVLHWREMGTTSHLLMQRTHTSSNLNVLLLLMLLWT